LCSKTIEPAETVFRRKENSKSWHDLRNLSHRDEYWDTLTEDEQWKTINTLFREGKRRHMAVLCEACAPVKGLPLDNVFLPAKPCETCKRPVRNPSSKSERAWLRMEVRGRHTFCSIECAQRGQVEQRKRERAAQRAELQPKCAVCGMPFTPKRKDAKTCGSACRQRRYREREATRR
jgi:hypothetical protein